MKLGKEPFRVDIICGIQGLKFDKAWKARVKGELFGVKTGYLSLDHLIAAKKAAKRPQDLVDVEKLLKVKRLKRKVNNS